MANEAWLFASTRSENVTCNCFCQEDCTPRCILPGCRSWHVHTKHSRPRNCVDHMLSSSSTCRAAFYCHARIPLICKYKGPWMLAAAVSCVIPRSRARLGIHSVVVTAIACSRECMLRLKDAVLASDSLQARDIRRGLSCS